MLLKIEAYQAAELFNIKKIKTEFRANLHSGSASELFYFFEETNRFVYIFDYGVVVFCNYEAVEKSEFLRYIKNYAGNILENDLYEEYDIHVDGKINKPLIKNDFVKISEAEPQTIRIIMLNIGQSVALEYYESLTDELLNSTKKYIIELEQKGRLSISKTALLKFIGKVLNVKNSIVDNLYILDDPNMTWENEDLDQLNRHLKANFDTNTRFKDLDYRLQIVENNLKLFTDVLNHRESSYLEWIVIILISIEIINTFFFRH